MKWTIRQTRNFAGLRDIARPIKVLAASKGVRAELRRRANGRSSEHRDRFRAEIILLRLDAMMIEDVAAHMNTLMRKNEGTEILAKIKRARAALDHAKAIM